MNGRMMVNWEGSCFLKISHRSAGETKEMHD